MLTAREALTRAAGQLAANPALSPTAVPDATLLLLHTLGIPRSALLAHPERPIPREIQAAYQSLINRRLAFEPTQYIIGFQDFYGLTLRVTPAVLIPRPETELLVEAVLTRLPYDRPIRIADVGTGSGAIAIALAQALPLAHVTAIDLSLEALKIARENAAAQAVADRIAFLHSDLFTAVAAGPLFDAIVSNPPYVPALDRDTLHPQVRDFEPAQALFAGSDGLDIYRRLLPQAYALLVPGGLLALELGHGQQESLTHLAASWQPPIFLPDLQGIPRVALLQRPFQL